MQRDLRYRRNWRRTGRQSQALKDLGKLHQVLVLLLGVPSMGILNCNAGEGLDGEDSDCPRG